jgi:hypothetical protein
MAKVTNEPTYVSRVDAASKGIFFAPAETNTTEGGSSDPKPPRNPYFTALVGLTIVFAAIAAIAGLIGSGISASNGDPFSEIPALAIASFSFSVACVLFLAVLVVGAINWQMRNLKK